jgi:hypothetical protein
LHLPAQVSGDQRPSQEHADTRGTCQLDSGRVNDLGFLRSAESHFRMVDETEDGRVTRLSCEA